MAKLSQKKWAERIIDEWLSGPMADLIDDESKPYVASIIEAFRRRVYQQSQCATDAALALERLICASLLARCATIKVRQKFTKEYFDMAIKANDQASKMLAAIPGASAARKRKPVVGIGTRLRPLMKKVEGAVEEAIAETEARRRQQQETDRTA